MTANTSAGPRAKRAGCKEKDKGRRMTRLLERIAAGDHLAFEKLYRHTAGSVYALARRVLPDDKASAEVTEQVYVRVWLEAHTYERTLQTAENWLLSLAHRYAVERTRTERTPASSPPASASPAVSLLPSLAGGRAGLALSLLTPEQAEALELAYLGGRTHSESAQALGVDQATFRIRVGTALSRLRQGMEPAAASLTFDSKDLAPGPT